MGTTLRRVLPAIVVAAVLVTGTAATAGGCKEVIGWQQATLLDAGTIGACTPGTTISCHTGPTGTEVLGEAVEICNVGNAKCNEDGTGYGACEGEEDVLKGQTCSLGEVASGVCNGTGTCVECNDPKNCTSGVCTANQCAAPTCTDGVKNGNETGIDCGGGTCPPCMDGMPCSMGTDCTGGACDSLVCCTPTSCMALGLTCGMVSNGCGGMLSCNDGVLDGDETGIDCGGPVADAGVPACPRCGLGYSCHADSDCESTFCIIGPNLCCNAACTSPCVTCMTGTCTPLASGTQTAECNALTQEACNSSGECEGATGHACTKNSDCVSDVCPLSVPRTCQ
jgi:hypothetical protein